MGHSLVDITYEPGADQIAINVDEATQEMDCGQIITPAAWCLGHVVRIDLTLETGDITATIIDHAGPRHGQFISGKPSMPALRCSRKIAIERLHLLDRIETALAG